MTKQSQVGADALPPLPSAGLWIIPGDDGGRASGFVDAMAWEQGEFTKPMYTADQMREYARAALSAHTAPVEQDKRQGVKNNLCIDGHLNATFDAIMASSSPDGIFCLITSITHKAVDMAFDAALSRPNAVEQDEREGKTLIQQIKREEEMEAWKAEVFKRCDAANIGYDSENPEFTLDELISYHVHSALSHTEPVVEHEEREAFEAAMLSHFCSPDSFDRHEDDANAYAFLTVRTAWTAWQARASRQVAHVVPSRDEPTQDQCIELAEELQKALIEQAITDTRKIAGMLNEGAFQRGFETACDEIETRLGEGRAALEANLKSSVPVTGEKAEQPQSDISHLAGGKPEADTRVVDWIEEAVEYVGCKTMSPSLEQQGRDLLATLKAEKT